MTRFDIVPERSTVWIDARSTLHPIHTKTSGLEGFVDVELDAQGGLDLSVAPSARLSLPVARLRSGNPLEERELKRRIMARRYPTIDGELIGIAPADGDGRYRVSGSLTFRGTTCEYEHDMVITVTDDDALRLEGDAVFDVRDFGMEPPKILLLRVEPDVHVTVEIIATRSRLPT